MHSILNKRYIGYLLSFFIPILLFLFVYSIIGIHPFGDKNLLTRDLSTQYIAFLSYFKEIISGNASPFYSFSKTIGGEMVGFGAYYLYSPFNLVTLLFPKENLPSAVLWITLLKTGCSGLTMYVYLHPKRKNSLTLLFAVSYAMMAYQAANQQNIMWMDSVILLPLIVWSIEKLVKKGSLLPYAVFLGMALVINYYTGYMLCIFSVLYFLYTTIFRSGWKNCNPLSTGIRFLTASCLAGGMACVVLLPTAFSLREGKAEFRFADIFDFTRNLNLSELFYSLLPGMYADDRPKIYCGLVILTFSILFLFCKKISPLHRLGAFLLLAVLFFSMYFTGPNRLWHATAVPAGHPFRYSFLFSFIMIALANTYVTSLPDTSVLSSHKINALLLIFCCIDLSYNSTVILKNMGYESCLVHSEQIRTTNEQVKSIQSQDSSFYRMEITNHHCLNDAMHFNYRGLGSYSSCEKTDTKTFAAKMGLNFREFWIAYPERMPLAMDCFLNFKYKIGSDNSISVNPYALPLGVLADESLYSVNMYQDQSSTDVFNLQNQIWASLTQDNRKPFIQIEAAELTRKDHEMEYEFTITSDSPVYTNIHNNYYIDEMLVTRNGQEAIRIIPEKQIYLLGSFQPEDTIRVKITSTKNINWYDLFFYYEDIPFVQKSADSVAAKGFQMSDFRESYLKGSIDNTTADYRYLLFTIPYDDGWHIYVDDIRYDALKALDCLISIPISPGMHDIVMYYIPKGLIFGGIITIFCIFLLGSVFLWEKARKRTY